MEQAINQKNLKQECWKRGLSVTELAKLINRSRVSVHRAVKTPHQHKPTYRKIVKKLAALGANA